MSGELTYYIDTYINGSFFSRSEPFYEKTECLNQYHLLSGDSKDPVSNNRYSYNIQVSMDLEDYHKLQLKSNRIRIRFLDYEKPEPEEVDSTQQSVEVNDVDEYTEDMKSETSQVKSKPKPLKAYRYFNGYIFLKTERNLKLLRDTNLMHYLSPVHHIGKNGGLFIADNIIKLHQLPLPKNTVISRLPQKYINKIDSNL